MPIHSLADHIVGLTEHRDRDLLDITLTEALMDLLAARQVAIFGVVSEGGVRRWLPLIQLEKGCAAEVTDPMWADFHDLQDLQETPQRLQCLNSHQRVEVESSGEDKPVVTLLPLFTDSRPEGQGVIEIQTDAKLTKQGLADVSRLQRVYRNMHSMMDYSEMDALTGLLNRKSFDDAFYKTLREETPVADDGSEKLPQLDSVQKDKRRSGPGASYFLAMIDIDHFKLVNDQHGHLIGDEVLILVARILKKTFRVLDRVYRFGGEEFVVLLRCKDHLSTVNALERFRVNMEEFKFPQAGRITASVGMSAILAGDSPSSACERADQAVYFAKKNGRNRVCSYTDLVQQGLLQADIKVGDVELF